MTARYGVVRPVLAFAGDMLRSGWKRTRALWQQRRLETGRNVSIHSGTECWGEGRIVIGDRVKIGRGVVLLSGLGATIEIGAGSVVEENCHLEACAGQILKLGTNFRLGSRSVITSIAGINWGDNGSLGSDSQVEPRENGHSGRLSVGRGVCFQRACTFDLCAEITIEDNVHSGANCVLYTHNHIPAAGKLIWDQGLKCSPIHIRQGVWIGHSCTFLPSVEVGMNAVVAASAVVTKSVDAGTIVGGVPARPISRVR